MTEHSTYVVPASAQHFGPMRGWQWVCRCGRRGAPVGSNAEVARKRGIAHVERAGKKRDPEPAPCQWFALCNNAATTTREHPILGAVPICDRCNDKVEAAR